MVNNKEERRCKKCSSLQTYIKFSTNERICRSCGNIECIELKGGNQTEDATRV